MLQKIAKKIQNVAKSSNSINYLKAAKNSKEVAKILQKSCKKVAKKLQKSCKKLQNKLQKVLRVARSDD